MLKTRGESSLVVCTTIAIGRQTQLAQEAEIVLESLQHLGANRKRNYRSLKRTVIGGFAENVHDNDRPINGFTDNLEVTHGTMPLCQIFPGFWAGFSRKG